MTAFETLRRCGASALPERKILPCEGGEVSQLLTMSPNIRRFSLLSVQQPQTRVHDLEENLRVHLNGGKPGHRPNKLQNSHECTHLSLACQIGSHVMSRRQCS